MTITLRQSQIVCFAGALLTFSVLPFVLKELPYGLRLGSVGQFAVVLTVAALWVCAANFLAIPRNREFVDATSRYLCVFWGPIHVGLFYLMWVSGRLGLGYWPQMYHPDPKEFPCTAIVYAMIFTWMCLAPVALLLPVVRLGLALRRRDDSMPKRVWELNATLLLGAASLWFLSADPHGLMSWFCD